MEDSSEATTADTKLTAASCLEKRNQVHLLVGELNPFSNSADHETIDESQWSIPANYKAVCDHIGDMAKIKLKNPLNLSKNVGGLLYWMIFNAIMSPLRVMEAIKRFSDKESSKSQ